MSVTRTLPTPNLARTVAGSGPGLLVAHGAGGGVMANYGPILDGLAARYTVVGVDYPGSGDSPRSAEPLTLDDLADQLVAAGDAEGLDTFAVSGFSLGGAVAIRAAARYPERVTALVLTATLAYPDNNLRLAARTWHELYVAGEFTRMATVLTPLALGAGALEALSPEELAAVIQGTADTAPAGTAEQTALVDLIDVRADLAGIDVPALVVSTTGDRLVSPPLHRELAAGLKNSRLVGIDTGHLPMLERPEQWLALITGFLDARSG